MRTWCASAACACARSPWRRPRQFERELERGRDRAPMTAAPPLPPRRMRVREYCANTKQMADATMRVMEAALLLGQSPAVVLNAERGEVASEAAANPL